MIAPLGSLGYFNGGIELKDNDRVIRIRSFARHVNGCYVPAGIVPNGQLPLLRVGQQICLCRFAHHAVETNPFRIPFHDMQIQLRLFLSHGAPGEIEIKRTRFRSVNRFSVDLHPFADGFHTIDFLRTERAFRCRPHIEEKVHAPRSAQNQPLNNIFCALPVVVVQVISPVVAHGHAGFGIARHAVRGNFHVGQGFKVGILFLCL